MLNLAVKNRPPQSRSPLPPSGRRARFSSSLPVYASRRIEEDNKEGGEGGGEEQDPPAAVAATLPATPSPAPPDTARRASNSSASGIRRSKSMSLHASSASMWRQLTPSAKRKSLSMDGTRGRTLNQSDFGNTLRTAATDALKMHRQQAKNVEKMFSKVEYGLQPAYDRLVRAHSQTYPFHIGIKSVEQLPLPITEEETRRVRATRHLLLQARTTLCFIQQIDLCFHVN